MQRQHFRRFGFFLAFLAVFSLAFTPVRIDPPGLDRPAVNPPAASQPDVYQVKITVMNLSEIDLTAGTYTLDFYISFICQQPPCQNEPNWDLMNAIGDIAPVEQGTSVPFTSYDYRLKTTLIGYVDYTFYPFDYLYLEMFIEDKELSRDQLTYQLEALKVDPMFNPAGWYYKPEQNGWQVDPISYFDGNFKYDRLYLWMFFERDRFGAFMKTIFAALVIVLVGMLSYLLGVQDAKERLALTSSTLVAIVLYHISLIEGVPTTGYLTFVDKFMIATYIVVFLSLVVSVLLMFFMDHQQKARAEKLHRATRWAVPLLWLLLMLYVFVFQLILPYQRLLENRGWAV